LKHILWLSNSEDISDAVPEHLRSWSLAGRKLEAALGEEVHVTARVIWPDPRLPDLVESWIQRYRPDAVVLRVNAYWYLYRSVPLRLKRRLGRIGPPIAGAGERAGRSRWSSTRAFHLARSMLLKTVGGDSFFTAQQVAEVTEECVRRIQRDESVRVVVNTTLDHWTSNPQPQVAVHRRLRAFCASVHAGYLGADPERDPPPPNLYASGDRLHTDAAGHAWIAERQASALLAVLPRELQLSSPSTSPSRSA
jgi:hypothetical protein